MRLSDMQLTEVVCICYGFFANCFSNFFC